MSRTIAVCPKQFPGVTSVFKHGHLLGLWDYVSLGEEIPDNDLLILGAWHQAYNPLLKKHNCVIYFTSTIGQMEFSAQSIELTTAQYVLELYEQKHIKAILHGWKDLAFLFTTKNPERIYHCPYPFDYEYFKRFHADEKQRHSIGMFLPKAPRKNIFNQLLAAGNINCPVYTNQDCEGPNFNTCGWLNEEVYYKLISQMIVTLHCTYTESFSYAAAESIALGTLPIASIQVTRNLNLPYQLCCLQCDSVFEIIDSLLRIMRLKTDEYYKLLATTQERLIIRVDSNLVEAKIVLDKIKNL